MAARRVQCPWASRHVPLAGFAAFVSPFEFTARLRGDAAEAVDRGPQKEPDAHKAGKKRADVADENGPAHGRHLHRFPVLTWEIMR